MNVAFDIDGTLTVDGLQLKKLAVELMKNKDNKVFILTGSVDNMPTLEYRRYQLEKMGFFQDIFYHELVRASGMNMEEVAISKAEFCRDNNIDMMFEDYEPYIKKINEISPQTSTWLIGRSIK